jgi:hypothetical protein
MITQEEAVALAVVPVNLGKGPSGSEPWAKPNRAEAWLTRQGEGDIVRFQCRYPFTVTFKNESPFEWTEREGAKLNGLFTAEGTVRSDALGENEEEKPFAYALTVDGQHVDPEVVVKKDPRG